MPPNYGNDQSAGSDDSGEQFDVLCKKSPGLAGHHCAKDPAPSGRNGHSLGQGACWGAYSTSKTASSD